MKRLWIGVAVLLVILGLGIGGMLVMEQVPGTLAENMYRAASLADESWEEAKALAESARAQWEKWEHSIAALTDHEPLEELKGLFSELDLSRDWQDRDYFATLCARIAAMAQALSESHSLHWWNLL